MPSSFPGKRVERWIAVPYRAIPACGGYLVAGSSGCQMLSQTDMRVLRKFDRLGPGDGAGGGAGAECLERLISSCLLVSEGEVLKNCRAAQGGVSKPEIAAAGVVTRDRPGRLAACVESLIENATDNGRRLEIVIIDHSHLPATREENLTQLRRFDRQAPIRYSGPEQRSAFGARLAARGIDPQILNAAFGIDRNGDGYGAARNALMLDQAGAVFLSADDDTIARTAVHPELKDFLRLVGHNPCWDLFFFRGRKGAMDCANWVPVDIIGEHARLIGLDLAGVAGLGGSKLNLEMICRHFAEDGWRPRIVGTMAGKVGDSGRNDPQWDVWAGNWFPGREELGRLEIAELPSSAAIGHGVGLMTTMFALDLRQLLPPFPPRHVGEDGVYAVLVDRLIPNACWGIVPHSVIHDRPARGLETSPPRLGFSQALSAIISGSQASQSRLSDADSMRALGEDLRGICKAKQEFRALTLERLAYALAAPLENIRRIHAEDGRQGYREWARNAGDLLTKEFAELCDGGEKFSPNFGWETFRAEVEEFGRVLVNWPAIFEAARDLRAGGIRPSVPISEC